MAATSGQSHEGKRSASLIFGLGRKCLSSQECIPVGCVPAARRPYAGVCLVRGVCLIWGGGCLPGPGGSAWSRGVCLVWGGVCLVRGGLPDRGGGSGIPACTEADTLPPCGQTHTCKNITLATTLLRPVTSGESRISQTQSTSSFIEFSGNAGKNTQCRSRKSCIHQ